MRANQKKNDLSDEERAKIKANIQKALKIISVLMIIISIGTIIYSAISDKKVDRKIANKGLDKLNELKSRLMTIKMELKSEEKQIGMSESYGLTDKGRKEIDDKFKEIRHIYSEAHDIFVMTKPYASKEQMAKAKSLFDSIENMINTL